jgi:hypothetical protein
LSGAAFSYVYDKEYQDKHLERIKKKLKYINTFLESAEKRKGAGGEEVKSNITDNESAKIKGARGYIQGYNGIAIADAKSRIIVAAGALGSGNESETFPEIMDKPAETIGTLSGKEEPLEGSTAEGTRGILARRT